MAISWRELAPKTHETEYDFANIERKLEYFKACTGWRRQIVWLVARQAERL